MTAPAQPQAARTALPWCVDDLGGGKWIVDALGNAVALVTGTDLSNGPIIVRAVNSHAALVDALRLVQKGIRRGYIKDQSIVPAPKPGQKEIELETLSGIVDAALAQATED